MLLDFGTTTLFMVIGYLIGSTSFAIIVSKLLMKEDIRGKGSGNAGATNTLRNYGFKVGLFVFILDICKPIISTLIAYSVRKYVGGDWGGIMLPAVGLAALIGHIFPIYFEFKGGKGAACLLGVFIISQWLLAIIGFIIFMAIVKKSRYVSLGSIIAPLVLIVVQISFAFTPHMNEPWSIPILDNVWWITTLFLIGAWIIVVYKHKENIKRLIRGKENKLKK